MTNEEIQKHIINNCRREDGSKAMDEQAFYEGAKWMRDNVVIDNKKRITIEIIKEIRKIEDEIQRQKHFCMQHNFLLESEKYRFSEEELRKLCSIIQNKYGTGYIY